MATDTLSILRGLVAARASENPQAYTRLSKAAHILAVFEITSDGDGWLVPSETGPGTYHVGRGTCECTDARLYTCKHQYAIQLLADIQRLASQQAGPAPARQPGPMRQAVDGMLAAEARRQETRAPETRPQPARPGPRDPLSCPDHGTRYLKDSKYPGGGQYCSAKLGDDVWCTWTTAKAARQGAAA